MGAGTALQAAAGIDDDAERLYREYMAINQWQVVPGLVRRFADESGATVDWLVSLGVAFHDELIVGGDESRPRSHLAKGGGQGLVDALRRAAADLGIDIALGRRVDRLLTDGPAVTGAAVGDDEITAGATVITTGGFGANGALLRERFPSVCYEDWTWYIGADGSRGDAFTLVAPIDGATEGHDRGLRTLEPHWIHRNEAMTPGWMVYVDGSGRRIIDETAPYGLLDAMVRSRGNVVYAIFDDAAYPPGRRPCRALPARLQGRLAGPRAVEPRNWCGDVSSGGHRGPAASRLIAGLARRWPALRPRWSGPSSATTGSPTRAATSTSARPPSSSSRSPARRSMACSSVPPW